MSHENSETIQQDDGLWYNVSRTVYPRILQGPFLHRDVAESAARRRSEDTDPFTLFSPLSPLGRTPARPQGPTGGSPSGGRFIPIGGMPAQIAPTGIGLIDAMLNSVYRDPLGGLGEIIGLPEAVNQFARGLLPGIFQSLARRPEKIFVFGRQDMSGAAKTGTKLLGHSFDASEMRKAIIDSLAESSDPVGAMQTIRQIIGQDALDLLATETGPGAQVIRLSEDFPLFNRFTPPHEVAHRIQELKGLGGQPSPRVVERLQGLKSLMGDVGRSPEEHAIQILGEFYSGKRRGLPRP